VKFKFQHNTTIVKTAHENHGRSRDGTKSLKTAGARPRNRLASISVHEIH